MRTSPGTPGSGPRRPGFPGQVPAPAGSGGPRTGLVLLADPRAGRPRPGGGAAVAGPLAGGHSRGPGGLPGFADGAHPARAGTGTGLHLRPAARRTAGQELAPQHHRVAPPLLPDALVRLRPAALVAPRSAGPRAGSADTPAGS